MWQPFSSIVELVFELPDKKDTWISGLCSVSIQAVIETKHSEKKLSLTQ